MWKVRKKYRDSIVLCNDLQYGNKNMSYEIGAVKKQTKTNTVTSVLERIIPTERTPLVNEVSANFRG
jgi:hypothetical protein